MTICDNCIHDNVCGCEGHLDEAMTYCADKIEKKTGVWVREENPNSAVTYSCSECGEQSAHHGNGCNYLSDYCPCCGTRMTGTREVV